ncbi:MAG TPA: arsenate reductase ArsC [Chloroflexi bacterium]|nr:arsenate reductase ArsC [Chloroflexota bacterium]
MNKDVRKTKVLFLCTGNTARSQMAEAFLRAYGGDRFEPYSAGLEPDVINPFVYRVLEEVGFDLEGQYSKSVMDYMGKIHFGFLITVCANAEERCPSVFPGVGQRLHWPFEDPAAFEGTEEEKLAKFREIRDQIEARIKTWLAGIFSISWGAVAGLPTEPQRARSGDRPEPRFIEKIPNTLPASGRITIRLPDYDPAGAR